MTEETKLFAVYPSGNYYELKPSDKDANLLLLFLNHKFVGETSFNEIRKYIESRGPYEF